ncbi:MAG: hypothetical protein JO261_09170 [Alphaproteobacteria bacterium]|nr:hypothetical protein [Alphaproteobacteria bacterium]MBV9693860.1 hypothetical protein [Alphaproteobacteria bacterium]
MAKAKLLEDIKADPSRFYPAPTDVIRDRRFSDTERLEILKAWERDARSSYEGEDDIGEQPGALEVVMKARTEVEERIAASPKMETGAGR